jgi:peptide/nickel transport system ATP-binding protein
MPDPEFTKNLRWKKISMVFQGAMNSLDPVFSIRKQFEEILKKHGYDQDLTKKIEEVTSSVELPVDILDKYPHELSGGMKQRIVIAMALLLKPELIIADEPTTALDVLVQAQIMALLKKFKMEGMSIMLISHDLAIISEIVEKIAVMYAGQVIEFGNLSEIYKNPMHPYTVALLDSVPKMREDKKLIALEGSPPSLIRPIKPGCRFYERCPRAMEKCKKDPPKIKTLSGYVSCWLYE